MPSNPEPTDHAEMDKDLEDLDDPNGRMTFSTFSEALNHYRIRLENLPTVHEFLAGRDYVEFYIPPSASYIAAVPREGDNKAFLGKGYIWHRTGRGQGELIRLPVNSLRDGGERRSLRADRTRQTCPTCWTELPASGTCPYC